MSSTRRTALVAGVLFVLAAAASIPALVLFQPVLTDPAYVLGTGADSRVLWGGVLELVTAITVIGTGVALYPVVKRQNHGIALGYVAGRLLEGTFIAVGLVSVLSIVSLRQGAAASDGASLVAAGKALVAVHDWTFLLGPGTLIGANTLMLAYLMYRSRLVPRAIAVIGLASAPLVSASGLAVFFGAYEQVSAISALSAIPVFVWEMSLAGYLIAKGFRPAPTDGRAVPPVEARGVLTPA